MKAFITKWVFIKYDVVPLLDYSYVAWSDSSSRILIRLSKLHNKMARVILNAQHI